MVERDNIIAELQQLKDRINHLAEIKTIEHEETRRLMGKFSELLEKHDHAIFGNAKVGLITQMDRLLQKEEGRTWALRTIAVSIVGLVAKAIFDVFTGRP